MSLLIMSDSDCEINEAIRLHDEGYKEGLRDAWYCAKRIVLPIHDGGIPYESFVKVFGETTSDSVIKRYSASEAIKRLKAYEEEEQKRIKVGDEVYFADENHPRVVTSIYTDNGCNPKAVQITESGKYCVDDVTELKKTGRHFPQIAEVLGQLKGEDCR